MTKPLGLYIHIPFCEKKCNYCDFYSVCPDKLVQQGYIKRLCEEIEKWGALTARPIDTLYIGGGTPSLLTPEELEKVFSAVKKGFVLADDAEITCEVNPADNVSEFLSAAKGLGVNRISIGIQSADDNELKVLGRRHSFADAVNTVKLARSIGFHNISADLMLGLPDSSTDTLQKSIDSLLKLNIEHISAYILKIEEGTPFSAMPLNIPSDDGVADQYLQLCRSLNEHGFSHYEISNFAKKDFESRHNNKYWLTEEYIGIGPSAHSFFDGKRFFYERDLNSFIENTKIIEDGDGGSGEEFVMLSLRLKRGLIFSELEDRFGIEFSDRAMSLIKNLEKNRLCIVTDTSVSLTDEGMLVSNSVINNILGVLYENL